MRMGGKLVSLWVLAAFTGCAGSGGDQCQTSEVCGNLQDDDCDGKTDEGCQVGACATDAQDGIDYYDDLTRHPGCTREPSDIRTLEYTPAEIPGYPCAAKAYSFPAGVEEDTAKPIVLLIHGNSDTPYTWSACVDGTMGTAQCAHHDEMIAERLLALGYRIYAVDMRHDMVCDTAGGPDPCTNNITENLARTMDHGWGVPIVMQFIRAVMEAHPDRRISILAHSFGVTTTRDALRRLQCVSEFNPWPRLEDVILAAGGNHGVSAYDYGLCQANPTMRGRVVCEMGSRDNYQPTHFTAPLNGPNGIYEVPCQNGQSAFGVADICGGQVFWTTIVMEDRPDNTYKDEFVSQTAAGLKGANNRTVGLDDIDTSGYYYGDTSEDGLGLFKSHFGSTRSSAALDLILEALQN